MSVVVLITDGSLPAPPPSPWIGVGIGVAVLAATAVLAIRHARRRQVKPPRRRDRILGAAIGCGVALTAMLIPDFIHEAPRGFTLSGLGGFGAMILIHLLIWIVLAFPLFMATDLVLDYFQPLRTRFTLALGPPVIAGLIGALLLGTGLVQPLASTPPSGPIPMILAVLTGGLGWWAFLPAPGADDARVFE